MVPYRPPDRPHSLTDQLAMDTINPGWYLARGSHHASASHTVDQLVRNWTINSSSEQHRDSRSVKEAGSRHSPQNEMDHGLESAIKEELGALPAEEPEMRSLTGKGPKKKGHLNVENEYQAGEESSSGTESFKSMAGRSEHPTSSSSVNLRRKNLEDDGKGQSSKPKDDIRSHAISSSASDTSNHLSKSVSGPTGLPFSPNRNPLHDEHTQNRESTYIEQRTRRNPRGQKKPKYQTQSPPRTAHFRTSERDLEDSSKDSYPNHNELLSYPPRKPSTSVTEVISTTSEYPCSVQQALHPNPPLPPNLQYSAFTAKPSQVPNLKLAPKPSDRSERLEHLEKLILEYQEEKAAKEAAEDKRKMEDAANASALEISLRKREQALKQMEDAAKRLTDKTQVLKVKDAVGRKFIFPFLQCRTWEVCSP